MNNRNVARRNHVRTLLGAIAALSIPGFCTSSALAVSYTLQPGGAPLDWNTASTWSPAGVPGGTVASDTAAVSGDFGGVSQTVNISSTLTTGLTALSLGDTNATPGATTIGSTGGSLVLTGATVTSAGTAGAVNSITAPITISGTSNLTFGVGTNALTISGKITPGAIGTRTIENASTQRVTLGDIDLSTGGATALLTIRNGNGTNAANNRLVLAGTIADGSGVSGLSLGNRLTGASIQIDGTNTYTGNTNLGLQANQNTLFLINSNQPFGPAANGTLNIGGTASGTTVNILEAVNADRAITKNTTSITRSVTFQGSNSIALNGTTITTSNTPVITNDIVTPGKTATLGTAGGNLYLNNNATDLFRVRTFTGAGTTIIASNVADNANTISASSRIPIQMSGTGSLVLTGTNTLQGGVRILATGTVQLGNGGTTGSLAPGNSLTPVVNGTAAGTLAFNRSDAVATTLTANGPINFVQKGSGSLTLSNSQYHSGSNTVGDGATASKLVVTGSFVPVTSTGVTGATIVNATNASLTTNTVTLAGGDTTASLNLKVGRPVYLTSGGASSLAYVDTIISSTQFSVFGGTLLAPGSNVALSFGEGSALGTSAATTTVNNLSTLGGTGVIAGAVNGLAGSHLAPGVNTVDGDLSGRFNFGVAGTLATGSLTLTGATLDFDLAATAAGTSDFISVGSGSLTFSSLSFTFDGLTAGVLEAGTPYNLVSGTGAFTGDTSLITTNFSASLLGIYTPTYAVNNLAGTNYLQVTFSAIPEPASLGLVLGLATLGGCLVRRRRQSQA